MDPIKPSSTQSGALSANNTLQGTESSAPPPPPLAASRAADCGASADASQELAVRSLLEAYSRPASAPLTVGTGTTSSASPRSDNNAARTSSRDAGGVYAESGHTSNGDGVFAGVAALKHHDSKSGVDVEVFSASAQFGAQTELQAGLARIGASHQGEFLDVNVSAEFLTARANGGIHNDDDSHGANLGLGATGAGVELTLSRSGWSLTGGVAASLGGAVSSGDRNIDGDETPEKCFKLSVGPATVGFCTEF